MNLTEIVCNGNDTAGDLTESEARCLQMFQVTSVLVVLPSSLSSVLIVIVLLSTPKRLNNVRLLYINILATDALMNLAGIFTFFKECGKCVEWIPFVVNANAYISLYTMFAIAYLRYSSIANPLKVWKSTRWGAKGLTPYILLLLALWLAGAGVVWFYFRSLVFPDCPGVKEDWSKPWVCFMVLYAIKENDEWPRVSLIGVVGIPLLLGLFFSARSIHILLKKSAAIEAEVTRKRKLKSAILISLMLFVLAINWVPLTAYFFIARSKLEGTKSCEDLDYVSWMITRTPLLIQPIFNPVLYWFFGDEFQKDVKVLLAKVLVMFSRSKNSNSPEIKPYFISGPNLQPR